MRSEKKSIICNLLSNSRHRFRECVLHRQLEGKFVLVLNMNQSGKTQSVLSLEMWALFEIYKDALVNLAGPEASRYYLSKMTVIARSQELNWNVKRAALPGHWNSKFSIDGVFSLDATHDSFNSIDWFFLGKKKDVFCMVATELDGTRSSSRSSWDCIKPKSFEVCGTLYAAVLEKLVSLLTLMAWPDIMWHILEEEMWQSGSSKECCTWKLWHLIWNQSCF